MYQPKKNHAFILLAFLSVCFVNFIGCKKTNNFATKLPMAPVLQKEEKPKLNWELYPNHPAKKIYEDLALETDDAFQVFLFFLLSKDLSMPDQDSFFQILNVDRKNENWEQKIKEKVEVLQQAVKTRKFLIRRKKVPFLFATSEKLAKLVLGSVPFNDFSDSGQEVFEKIPTKNLQKSTIVGYLNFVNIANAISNNKSFIKQLHDCPPGKNNQESLGAKEMVLGSATETMNIYYIYTPLSAITTEVAKDGYSYQEKQIKANCHYIFIVSSNGMVFKIFDENLSEQIALPKKLETATEGNSKDSIAVNDPVLIEGIDRTSAQANIWLKTIEEPSLEIERLQSKNSIQNFECYDFSNVLTPKFDFIGFIEPSFQKLQMVIEEVKKSNAPNIYNVKGFSKVRKNKCSFTGAIKIKDIREYTQPHYGCDLEFLTKFDVKTRGVLFAEYFFEENQQQKASGFFKGILTSYWYLTNKNEIKYDNILSHEDRYCNNQYIGTWQSNKTNKVKISNWGELRIPLSGDLDIGVGEFHPNPKYSASGWQ
jgi:hypothetical protein